MLGVGFSLLSLMMCLGETWLVSVMMGLLSMVVLLMLGSWHLCLVKMSMGYGGDLLGMMLVMLSLWLLMLMVMASEGMFFYMSGKKNFYGIMVMMGILLSMFFWSENMLMFYVYFEGVLIPIFLMVTGYGYQPERLMAGLYMFFYTLFASLPLLVGMMWFEEQWGCLSFQVISLLESEVYGWWSVTFMLAFLVKMPMYFVHLWLPSAHVEAPVAGSMILAGVLLKLGGYGLYRFLFFSKSVIKMWGGYMVSVGLMGGLFVGLICLVQIDLKSLIAYSSVAHMGLVMAAIFSGSWGGYQGGFMMMVAHGLCSSGLFCLANILYERFSTRSMLLLSGMMGIFPGLSLWWFLFSTMNMAAPPGINMFGEVMILISVVSFMWWSVLVMMGGMFIAGAYSLWMYSCINHSEGWGLIMEEGMILEREYLLMFCHWFPLNLIIMKMDVVSLWVF
uniref:NADH-ubiquinone oxidoreductase chain 4 n=1 Tax=Phrynus sp. 1 SEM-2008 TaxID=507471 RepID=B2CKE1_9ARAC|nr:NADH dehydrogenase subunit 4 [Phrynus sp. 1 SEM-2008]